MASVKAQKQFKRHWQFKGPLVNGWEISRLSETVLQNSLPIKIVCKKVPLKQLHPIITSELEDAGEKPLFETEWYLWACQIK